VELIYLLDLNFLFKEKMAVNNVKEIEDLVKIVSKLPGLGPKSAKRIVLKLINNREELIRPLTNTLAQVYKNVVRCKVCGNLKSINLECICSSKKYDQICVVENIADMWVIQSSGIYKGHYHILGGTLPSFESKKNGSRLLIESLVNRVKKNQFKEVILATSASVEGETTSHYVSDCLKETNVKITRLAKGVPVGGEIEFLDDGTLYSAFKNRNSITND
jgi:recombination protein RecR